MKLYVYCTFVPEDQLVGLAALAEELGFDGISCPDHVIYPLRYDSPYPYTASGEAPWNEEMSWPDPLLTIATMAVHTTALRFVTGVFVLPLRHPLLVAKSLSTLDALTAGRVELGIGVGWLREEFEALDQDFGSRGRRTDEAIEVMRKAWSGKPVEHHGEFFDFEPMVMRPAPARPIPIYVGGASPRALDRAARLGDGFIPPVTTQAETRRLLEAVEAGRARHGRESEPFEVVGSAVECRSAAELEELGRIGITTVRVDPFSLYGRNYGGLSFDQRRASLERYAREVIVPLRDSVS
jgi:probable F420-dependent oxidoreductase